jgi:hypothetical protein
VERLLWKLASGSLKVCPKSSFSLLHGEFDFGQWLRFEVASRKLFG